MKTEMTHEERFQQANYYRWLFARMKGIPIGCVDIVKRGGGFSRTCNPSLVVGKKYRTYFP